MCKGSLRPFPFVFSHGTFFLRESQVWRKVSRGKKKEALAQNGEGKRGKGGSVREIPWTKKEGIGEKNNNEEAEEAPLSLRRIFFDRWSANTISALDNIQR